TGKTPHGNRTTDGIVQAGTDQIVVVARAFALRWVGSRVDLRCRLPPTVFSTEGIGRDARVNHRHKTGISFRRIYPDPIPRAYPAIFCQIGMHHDRGVGSPLTQGNHTSMLTMTIVATFGRG